MNQYDLGIIEDVLDLQSEYEFTFTKRVNNSVSLTFVSQEEIIIDLDTLKVAEGDTDYDKPTETFKRFLGDVKSIMENVKLREEDEYQEYVDSVKFDYYRDIL